MSSFKKKLPTKPWHIFSFKCSLNKTALNSLSDLLLEHPRDPGSNRDGIQIPGMGNAALFPKVRSQNSKTELVSETKLQTARKHGLVFFPRVTEKQEGLIKAWIAMVTIYTYILRTCAYKCICILYSVQKTNKGGHFQTSKPIFIRQTCDNLKRYWWCGFNH